MSYDRQAERLVKYYTDNHRVINAGGSPGRMVRVQDLPEKGKLMAKPKAKPAKRARKAPAEPDFYIIRYLEQRSAPGVGWDMAVTYAPTALAAENIGHELLAIGRLAIKIKPWTEIP